MSGLRQGSSHVAPGLIAAAGMVLIPLLLMASPRGEAVAVIGPPGSRLEDLARLVAEADGEILRAGPLDILIVARAEHPGFVRRLYAAGAWLVLDPVVAGGCAPSVAPPALSVTRTMSLP